MTTMVVVSVALVVSMMAVLVMMEMTITVLEKKNRKKNPLFVGKEPVP